MAGTALPNFPDYVKATPPSIYSSAEHFLNEAVNQTYLFPRFLRGKDLDKVLQGGREIRDEVMFDHGSTAQHYLPNEDLQYTQPQVLTEQKLNWRFTMDHMSWTEHEVELNTGGHMSRDGMKWQYKRLKKKIEQRMWVSLLEKIETSLWADAAGTAMYNAMEGSGGNTPMSIPAYITEDTTNYHAQDWTNVMNIDPANESKWRNQVNTYNFDDPFDNDNGGNGLMDAFDDMFIDTRFVPPDYKREYYEPLNMQSYRNFIACSKEGFNLYKKVLRSSNDNLIRKTDAGYGAQLTFDGIDVVPVTHLNTATIMWDPSDSAVSATEANANKDGRRYFWINGNYMTPVFHTTRYFKKTNPFSLEKQPWTWVCPVDCWWNVYCHSRQRQGIVCPAS